MAGANTDPFDAYFKRADLDGDGQISGAEAVAFLQGSGLPKQVLAQVWMYADHRKASYLGRQEFYNALKLVTVAQNKRDLTPDIVKAALYSPASAKIPAPQINLAATPAPRVAPPAPQSAGVASQNVGARPPQVPGNVNANRQYLPSQQNQLSGVALQNVGIRTPQSMPPGPVSLRQQILASQGMPSGGPMTAPRPPNSNSTTDLLGGNTGGSVSLTVNRGISPPVNKDGFGLTTSGVTPYVQPRPPAATGQMPSASLKPQDGDKLPNQTASNDSKTENGFAADSLFGDVFSANPAQPKQGNVSDALPASSLPASSASAPSVGPQPSTKPGLHDSSQSTFSQQPVSSQPTGGQCQQAPAQRINDPPSTGFPVGVGNSAAPGQSQHSWPKMTQSAIQKYMKVFVQVDTDRNGKITGEQARNLFLSWRLPREVLKQVWDLSDQDNDSMLSLKEFCTALYLMERYREGRPLPATLPSTLMSDETVLSATSHPTSFHGSGAWGPSAGLRPPQVPAGARPVPAAAARPPRPPTVPHADEKPLSHQKPKVPVLEMHLVDQLSQVEQDSLNSKFQDAEQADKKVEELEKEIVESRQKIEFYRVKMQELILYKSRCDNRLNEVTARVAADKQEAEVLARKYEEKYKQTGDVPSKLTIEEATFRDIQERKMELYRVIVKLEEGGAADGVIKERAENIRSGLEELVKNVNERCKQYGLRSKPTSLFELPFGWQPGIQEGAADWDEDWDKFEDEGFSFVKELTLDVKNVVAPPKPKSSPVQKETSARKEDAEAKSDKVPSSDKPITDKEPAHEHNENGVAKRPPESPAGKSPTESHSHEFRDSPFRDLTGADSSLHAKENQSDVGGAESGHSGYKSANEPSWGTFDSHYDTESVWGFDKDMDHEKHSESSIFGLGEFNLNPIKTGSSGVDNMFKGKNSSIFADSVPSTPAYNPGHSAFPFADSVPSTPAYNQGKNSYLFADSVPSTPAYNQGTSPFTFADSVPGTPAYNFGNSPRRFSEGSEDHSFYSFSRFDSFSIHDGGLFQSPRHSLSRFDSMRSTRDSDQNYGFPSRFDSFKESGDFDQGFSRFDSFRESDQSHGLSRFDSFRESEQSHGFPSRFDSFREPRDTEHRDEFSRFDSFNTHDSGFFQSSGSSFDRFDSVRGSREPDHNRGFSSFDEADPFGSSGPFRTSLESETPRKSTDDWKAF